MYLLFIFLRLSLHGFDPSIFITAGDRLCDPDFIPEKVVILKDSYGYDGQFYYRLALDPFTSKRSDYGVALDNPPYRHQRILYPLIVWLLSLGHVKSVPILMILVNYGGLCLIGWMGGMFAHSMRQHALWGLLIALYPGFVLTLSRDLGEILEIGLVLASLLCIRNAKHLLATIFLTLAIFAKETALLVALGLFGSYVWYRSKNEHLEEIRWYLFASPALCYFVWQFILLFHWGELPIFAGRNILGFPFFGVGKFFLSMITGVTISQSVFLCELLFIIGFTVCVICSFGLSLAKRHEKLSWLLYALLISLLTNAIWIEDWEFFRAISCYYVLGSIIIIGSRSRIKVHVFTCSVGIWLFVFGSRIFWI